MGIQILGGDEINTEPCGRLQRCCGVCEMEHKMIEQQHLALEQPLARPAYMSVTRSGGIHHCTLYITTQSQECHHFILEINKINEYIYKVIRFTTKDK